MKRYDPVGNISSLQEVFISRASARQRAGRAGRVQAGHAWHVYHQEFAEGDRVDDYPLPEIWRVPLEDVVLQVLFLKLGRPEIFLGQCLDPPSFSHIKSSVICLIEIKAVLPLAELPLTALGYHLAKMPVDVKLGKILIYSSLLLCSEPVLTIVAAMGGRSPFISPIDRREDSQRAHSSYLFQNEKNSFNSKQSINSFSDHLAVLNAYNHWNQLLTTKGSQDAYNYCKANYLSYSVLMDMKDLRGHFKKYLSDAGQSNSY